MKLKNRTLLTFLVRVLFISTIIIAVPTSNSFADCDPNRVQILKDRVFKNNIPDSYRDFIFSTDVLKLVSCLGVGSESPLHRLEQTLEKYETHTNTECILAPYIDSKVKEGIQEEEIKGNCLKESDKCMIEVFVRRGAPSAPRRKDCTKALSGGLPFAQLIGHWGKKGHYELTQVGIQNYEKETGSNLSEISKSILQDASRDPDFYDWETPAAHAQTEHRGWAMKAQDSKIAQNNFINWVSCGVRKVFKLCEVGKVRESLYILGYSMHALQDLVFHEGITNAEHSYRDKYENLGVDYSDDYEKKMEAGTYITTQYLRTTFDTIAQSLPQCAEQMKIYDGAGSLTSSETAELLGKERDFTYDAYKNYSELAERVYNLLNPPNFHKPDLGWIPILFIKPRWIPDRNPEKSHLVLDETVRKIFEHATSEQVSTKTEEIPRQNVICPSMPMRINQ